MWPKFKTQAEVPEAFRGMYEEKDGEWQVKAEFLKTEDEGGEKPEELKGALDKEREARKKAEKDAKDLAKKLKDIETKGKGKDAGLDDEKIEELRKQITADLTESMNEVIAEKDKEIERLKGVSVENQNLKLTHQLNELAATGGVRKERLEAWRKLNSDEFELDANGRVKLKAHPGKMPIDFVRADLKKRYPEFYEGSKGDGGGAGGGHGGVAANMSADDVLKNPTEALTAARTKQASA
jgi:hypothetical protein